MLRFSHWVVPVGKVPSTGKAETGMLSPLESMISPSTLRTNSGASFGTACRRVILEVISVGTLTSYRFAMVRSTASKFFLDDCFAALAVGLFDGMLDFFNGSFARQDAADGKEGRLHDGVHASAHAGLFSDFVAVDDIELELLLDDVLLDFDGQIVPDFIRAIQTVEQEDARLVWRT